MGVPDEVTLEGSWPAFADEHNPTFQTHSLFGCFCRFRITASARLIHHGKAGARDLDFHGHLLLTPLAESAVGGQRVARFTEGNLTGIVPRSSIPETLDFVLSECGGR